MKLYLAERFWSKVDKSGDCWEWTSARSPKGYAAYWLDGRNRQAHRLAWRSMVGPIPAGLVIDHLCRNRGCVNPSHMELVTPRENQRRGLQGVMHTHCPKGHELSADNLVPSARQRRCLTCHREVCRNYMRRMSAERSAA